VDNVLNISATVVTYTGALQTENKNNFYLDGRHIYQHEINSVEVSTEKAAQDYMFAVCDGMGGEAVSDKYAVSILKELQKVHKEVKDSKTDIDVNINKLSENVQLASNMIYTKSINSFGAKETAFAGMIISSGKAAAINLGSSSIYLLRNGNLNDITYYNKKANRLYNNSAISDEQVREIARRDEQPGDESKLRVKVYNAIEVREGDIFLLCTDGLTSGVEDNRIQSILISNEDTQTIANTFIKEAVKNGYDDNITVLVIKVEKTGKDIKPAFAQSTVIETRKNRYTEKPVKANENISTYIAAAITCVVVVALIIVAIILWYNSSNLSGETVPESSTQASTTLSDASDTKQGDQATTVEETTIIDEQAVNAEPTKSASNADANAKTDTKTNATDTIRYQVVKGDTLQNISIKFYKDAKKYKIIMDYNKIKDPNSIKAGQILIIPKEVNGKIPPP
jgi:PPM family protein phosphatase